jgi:hypothetical protein
MLPDTKQDPHGEEHSFAEWLDGFSHPLDFAEKGYQYPGVYLSLTICDEKDEIDDFKGKIPFSVHLRGNPATLIHHAEISKGDEIDFVVPDSPQVGWGLKGHHLLDSTGLHFYYTEDLAVVDDNDELLELDRQIPAKAKPIKDDLIRRAKREEQK